MPEIKKTKRETIAQLAEKFPGVATFEVAYQGAGDNFDSFFDFIMKDSAGNEIESSQTDEDSFLTIADDYIWHIFDKAQSQPDFNNDGSEGKVIFDKSKLPTFKAVTKGQDSILPISKSIRSKSASNLCPPGHIFLSISTVYLSTRRSTICNPFGVN